jgi:hypothetical protein
MSGSCTRLVDPTELSTIRFIGWSFQYRSFEEWNDLFFNTPGRAIRESIFEAPGRAKAIRMDYSLEVVALDRIELLQRGEDYDNASSMATAAQIASGSVLTGRLRDLAPVLLDRRLRLLDRHHRHAAATFNKQTGILALRPIRRGCGQVINLRQWYDTYVTPVIA